MNPVKRRPGQHVKPLERRRFEGIVVGFGVQRELHAERITGGDRQRRIGLKSDLLGSVYREDRQHEKCRQGYFRKRNLIALYFTI